MLTKQTTSVIGGGDIKFGIPSKVGTLLTSVCIYFLMTSSAWGQCEPPALNGVDPAMKVEYSYVKTQTTRTVYPAAKMEAGLTDLEWSRAESRTLIEQYFVGESSEGEKMMVSQVLNPSEYFPKSVYPHTHVIVLPQKISIYNKEVYLGSYAKELKETVDIEVNNQPEISSPSQNQIKIVYNDFETLKDTVEGYEIMNSYENDGSLKVVQFVQYDPNEPLRSVPIFSSRIEKQIDKKGDCQYYVSETFYSDYCANQLQDRGFESRSEGNTPKRPIDINFQIHPNPAYHELTLSLDAYGEGEQFQVQVVNHSGQVLRNQEVPAQDRIRLDIADLPNGFYLLRVKGEKSTFVNKFIKQ